MLLAMRRLLSINFPAGRFWSARARTYPPSDPGTIPSSNPIPMMTPQHRFAALSGLAVTLAAAGLLAQSFAVHTISLTGGGGTSHGGGFGISGSVGELPALPLTGPTFSVSPGYWNVVAAPNSPEPPMLALELNPDGSVTLSWPATAAGFVLQQSTDLIPGSWVSSPAPVSDDGVTRSVRISTLGNRLFLRLAR